MFTSAGVSDHVVASGLTLESGQLYFMSIKGLWSLCDIYQFILSY